MNHYLRRGQASAQLGIHYNTLINMQKRNEIKTIKIGGQRLYNVHEYIQSQGLDLNINSKKNICYCRVSSRKQKEDLERQIEFMKKEYPFHEVITDIASGLNFKRRGLKKILRYAISGEINEIVIAYKDRLARFGFELIEWLIKEYSDGKITVISSLEEQTPINEISKDIISIMNVYVAKINGLRKYKKKIKNTLINAKKLKTK